MRSRLPERFAGRLPPVLVEVLVGVGLTAVLALARMALVPAIGEVVPYALVFAAVAGSTVFAGWRSGLVALLVGQALTWIYATQPFGSLGPKGGAQLGGLLLASFSQLLLLAIIALYQREVSRAWSKREVEFDFLEKALKEIDHRTSNNYQTVLALVLAQANASDGEVASALKQVADRITAIASVSKKLAVASQSLEKVRIDEHLHDLCDQIERGLVRSGIALECSFEDILLGADETICISILVNELVTNALKHAFPGGRSGTIRLTLHRQRGMIELAVADDGIGLEAVEKNPGGGLGSRLIETFVRRLKAKHDVSTDGEGTRHRILIPD